MKTWFRRVRHVTRYVSSILKLISSIISASSRWKASRKKVSKGLRQFSKKDFKDFQVSLFQDNNSRINFPRWSWWDSRIPRQSGCRDRVPKIQPKRQLIKRNSKSSYTVCYQTTAEPRLEWVCTVVSYEITFGFRLKNTFSVEFQTELFHRMSTIIEKTIKFKKMNIIVIICQNIRFKSDGYLEQIGEFISAPPMIY